MRQDLLTIPTVPGLNTGVLVLNSCWRAIDVTPLYKALASLFSGEAKAAHRHADSRWETFDFQNWCEFGRIHNELPAIRTPTVAVPKPKIIILSDCAYRKHNFRVPFSRNNIFIRDNHTCQYCARQLPKHLLNLDHVIPRGQGGRTNWTNIVCSCLDCNTRKANRTPAQAGMKLLSIPREPKQLPIKLLHQEWGDFLSEAYWNVTLLDD